MELFKRACCSSFEIEVCCVLVHLNVIKNKIIIKENEIDLIIIAVPNNHHWYTQLLSDQSSTCIYTIAYLSNTFEMKPNTIIHFHNNSHKSNLFDTVTKLTLTHQLITDKYQYDFTNITSLTLISSDVVINDFSE
ncbi:unnamed protein product [Rotaria sordida]|uniref:Uncharacterized protein n=1 Tax=Rotaria sordida TaxID=392033 RepID=A0A815EXV1_9BILA|nr:unnamed protein product [Rotaria sordida]CAF1584203.1 unnamed protein product [Rotaria sordida]